MEPILDKILSFIGREFAEGRSLQPEDALLNGIIDSMGIFVLVEFLEKEFAVRLDDTELTVDNFETARTITHLLERKIGAS